MAGTIKISTDQVEAIATSIESRALCPLASILAATAPEKPKVDPTDKSIPEVKITKVIPAAIIALIEVCLKTFNKLLEVKNLGLIILIIIENTINPINGLILFKILFVLSFIQSLFPIHY